VVAGQLFSGNMRALLVVTLVCASLLSHCVAAAGAAPSNEVRPCGARPAAACEHAGIRLMAQIAHISVFYVGGTAAMVQS
jgi:hypothetical protein